METYSVTADVSDVMAKQAVDAVLSELRGTISGSDERYIRTVQTMFSSPEWERRHTLEEQRAFLNDVQDISLRGALHGTTHVSYDSGKPIVPNWTPCSGRWNREFILGVYARNPSLAEVIVNKHVVGLHLTSSGSLLSIMDHGLLPLKQMMHEGMPIYTGAHDAAMDSSVREGVSCVSLTGSSYGHSTLGFMRGILPEQVEKTIRNYEEMTTTVPERLAELFHADIEIWRGFHNFITREPADPREALQQRLLREPFPVVFGVSVGAVEEERDRIFDRNRDERLDKCFIPISDITGEFVVRGGITKNNIGIILVDSSNIDFVQQLIDETQNNIVLGDLADVPALAA